MGKFVYLLNILIVCFMLACFAQSEALACRCLEPLAKDAYAGAYVVIQARVIEVVPAPEGDGGIAILSVSQAWKRDIMERLAVMTVTSCAYPWQEGKEYILFLVRESTGLFSTARCLGNKPLAEAAELIRWLHKNGHISKVKRIVK